MDELILYAGVALAVVVIAATVVMILRNRCTDEGLLCVRETWMTAVLGAMLLAMGFFFTYVKLTDPTAAGTDRNSYWFIAGFSLACHVMGCYMMLYTFIKRIVLFDDRVESISAFGKTTALRWDEIVKVDRPMLQNTLRLRDKHDHVISVSGTDKGRKEFESIARDKIQNASGSDLLRRVENRLKGPRL